MEKLTWEIRKVKLSELKPLEKNPFGKVTEEKKRRLRESLKRLGNFQTATVDTDMVLLTANKRHFALIELGETETEVKYPSRPLTEAERKEIIVSSNLHEGDWIAEILAEDYQDIDLKGMGLEMDALVEGIMGKREELQTILDEFDGLLSIQTDIMYGDVFQIGPHRLMCGDSTNADDVAKLLNEATPELMVTDPPYGVNYDASWRNEAAEKGLIGKKGATRAISKVANDDEINWEAAWALSPCKVAYVWHASLFTPEVQRSLQNVGFQLRSIIIWAKNNFAISRGHYHWKHETCLYAVKKDCKSNWIGDRSQTTVWEIDKPLKSETGHSTQKPIECMKRPLVNHSGDVYDPFIGSGTTMVAAELMERICYGMELKPEHCQMVIDRMKNGFPSIKILKNGLPI